MTYLIQGLDPAPFHPLFEASDEQLTAQRAVRVEATSDTGFPCRVSLEEAKRGESLILVHHVSNDVELPFRMAHAIYIRPYARRAAPIIDRVPELLDRRMLGLRAFDRDGMMFDAKVAYPGTADELIRGLLSDDRTAYVHAHNAAQGCFLAAIERHRI